MINFFPPAIITYSDNLPEWKAGEAQMFFITIRPAYRDDKGILMHELAHVAVWWLTLGILDMLSRRFRLWNEARAYRIQMKYPDRHGGYLPLDAAAARLANPSYGFNLTLEEARHHIISS